jgi:hypothetical protein
MRDGDEQRTTSPSEPALHARVAGRIPYDPMATIHPAPGWRGSLRGRMADFGLQGVPSSWGSPDYVAFVRDAVESLPDVFTIYWVSDHLQPYGDRGRRPGPGSPPWRRRFRASATDTSC